ncbi:MAG: DUF805 domain-containing protein [Coriobacteriia bacterium]|nr:DUF805 domain-containing protein [Coriobacteriia bacterium]
MTWLSKEAFQNALEFEGRASRRDFWLPFLAGSILPVVLVLAAPDWSAFYMWLAYALMAALGLVMLPTAVRRLHDSEMSGYWLLLLLTGGGGFFLALLLLRPSSPEVNRYGPPPVPAGVSGIPADGPLPKDPEPNRVECAAVDLAGETSGIPEILT